MFPRSTQSIYRPGNEAGIGKMNTGYWNCWGEEGIGGLKTDLRWPFWNAKFLVLLADKQHLMGKWRSTRTTWCLVCYMFSSTGACLLWTKCSDQLHQRRSYLYTKSYCSGCWISLRSSRMPMIICSSWPPPPLQKEFNFTVSHQMSVT